MYLSWSLCTVYLLACQVRVATGNLGLHCYVCVTFFWCRLAPLLSDLFLSLHWTRRVRGATGHVMVQCTRLSFGYCYVPVARHGDVTDREIYSGKD